MEEDKYVFYENSPSFAMSRLQDGENDRRNLGLLSRSGAKRSTREGTTLEWVVPTSTFTTTINHPVIKHSLYEYF